MLPEDTSDGPDRTQIEAFYAEMFRHADDGTYAAVRAFHDDRSDPFAVAQWSAPKINGQGFRPLTEAVVNLIEAASDHPTPVVVCPPLATFTRPGSAKEADLANGLVLSVELDAAPAAALAKVTALLGQPTAVVASGGEWTNPETGEVEAKLHVHYRLSEPTRTAEEHARLKETRARLTALVGGDPTNIPAVHPLRAPGAPHRKRERRWSRLLELNADRELGLEEAHELLPPLPNRPTTASTGTDSRGMAELVRLVATGESYHCPLTALAMRQVKAGRPPGQVVEMLRGIMHAVPAERRDAGQPGRWQARFDEIPRLVSSAEAKLRADLVGAIPDQESVEPKAALPFNLTDLAADRWSEEPEPIRWLVQPTIPLGSPGMVAAMGDAGKTGLLFELALRVATGESPIDLPIFGGQVAAQGTVVIFTAEDHQASVCRRLHALDPFAQRRRKAPGKLLIAALPSLGGAFGLVRQDGRGLERTEQLTAILGQLRAIPDLRLVVFDPLQAFVHADVNAAPEAAQFFCTALAEIAATTGATVITAHHMRKPSTPPKTPEEAREAIRGTTALIDGLRFAYAIWAASQDEARRLLREISRSYEPNTVFKGSIVKSNEPARREVRTLVRSSSTGVLQDLTDRLKVVRKYSDDELAALVTGIADAAKDGRPLCRHGQNGIYHRREILPAILRKTGRDTLEEMASHLLSEGRIVQALASGTTTKWLDVPEGPFARGEGAFAAGSRKGQPGPRGAS
ncbi:AAA family ATPase [Geminicoccus harenae]|uniref:AAA family ATPase n=1 Tax=Geminicoccus harenae TaxID=2498453 RepID=UPI00168B9C3B|nr:AAA family ATPase [Geminicoccus harenae]